MAGEPIVEFTGRLVRDPELAHVAGGTAVANFAVAVTPRTKNSHTGTWEDGTALFFDCTVWRQYAENVAASYHKGTNVWVRGRLVDDSYERDGQTVRRWKVEVDETGPTLRFNTATVADSRSGAGPAAPTAPPRHAAAPAAPSSTFDAYAPPF